MSVKTLKKQSQNLSILLLSIVGSSSLIYSSNALSQQVIEEEQPIERILVTGSRIKRTQYESANLTQIITAEEIKNKGFNTIFETLQESSAATGSSQNGSSARNIETLNLRGLGPNRTLILINGKRVANYPRVYNNNDNAFNIGSIPISIVEQIEIITTASSSIYGSDAVGGVVNIITKKDVNATTLNINASTSTQGGANNKRLSLITGNTSKKGNWTFTVELEDQDGLTGKQRKWLDNRFDTPADLESQSEFRTALPRSLAVFRLEGDDFVTLDPGQKVCDQYEDVTYTSISGLGNYCGRDDTGDNSLINAKENGSLYFSGEYKLSNNHTVIFDAFYWQSKSTSLNSFGWNSDYLKDEIVNSDAALGDGQFYIAGDTNYHITREFQSEELLNGKGREERFDEKNLNTTLSLQGTVFSDYDYEVYVSHSLAKNTQTSYQLKTEVASDYFVDFNEEAGTVSVDFDRFFQPLDEEGFNTIFELDKSKSDSSVFTANASITGETTEIFNTVLEFATFIEFESSQYDLNEHPRTLGLEGQGFIGKTGTEGSAKRNRYAIGGEARVPILDNLIFDISARYDKYIDDSAANIAPTYKLGLEWTPFESLLLRTTHGTTFRAPDLHNVFKGESTLTRNIQDFVLIDSCNAFNQGDFDNILIGGDRLDLLARTCDVEFEFSGFYNVTERSLGNRELKPETGYTTTAGFVWAPYTNASLSFDYYKIKLTDIVTADNLRAISINEFFCLTGRRDITSTLCVTTLEQIDRIGERGFDSFTVSSIDTSFINSSLRETSGFDISLNMEFSLNDHYQLKLKTDYSHVLKTSGRTFADEPISNNLRDNYFNNDLRSKINSTLTLQAKLWRISLTHLRFGSIPNDVDSSDFTQLERIRYAPLNLYNMTAEYQLTPKQSLRAGAINLFNSRARFDASEQRSPFFDTRVYPTNSIFIGRQLSLGYQITF